MLHSFQNITENFLMRFRRFSITRRCGLTVAGGFIIAAFIVGTSGTSIYKSCCTICSMRVVVIFISIQHFFYYAALLPGPTWSVMRAAIGFEKTKNLPSRHSQTIIRSLAFKRTPLSRRLVAFLWCWSYVRCEGLFCE